MATHSTEIEAYSQPIDLVMPARVTVVPRARHREVLSGLNLAIDQIIQRHQAQAAAVGLTLTFAPSPRLPASTGDCHRLAQMLEAVVVSALEHRCRGWIKITTSHAPTAAVVIIDVVDNRDGICVGELAHAKQAQEIAAECQGTLWTDNTPGMGSRFSIQFPCLPDR